MTTFLVLGGWFVLSVVLGFFLGPCIGGRPSPVIIAAGRRPVDRSRELTPGAASQLTPRRLYTSPVFSPEAYAELAALLGSESVSNRRAVLCAMAYPRRMNKGSGALPCFTWVQR